MIPAAAVEAAAKEIYRVAADLAYEADTWDDLGENQRRVWIDDAKRILEAAAPHMLAGRISDLDELEKLPIKSVVLDRFGEAYQRIDMEGAAIWSGGDLVTSGLIDLPATVIYRPTP